MLVVGVRMLEAGSEATGEALVVLPYALLVLPGEFECDDGVGLLVLGDDAWASGCSGDDTPAAPGSVFIEDADRRAAWCRFMIARWIGGGCTRFWGI